jgi:predicted DNA-binding transcriptional regulator YafY
MFRMSTPTARLLELLSILQRGGQHSGPDLADHLGVTERTVRRDVERLRDLGYAIEARRGSDGAYRLGAGGSALPPLLVDEEEAIALAVCVRTAAGDSVRGVGVAAERALGKLRQSLSPRARTQVEALSAATVRLPSTSTDAVDDAVLLDVSAACRTPERLAIRYRAATGIESDRRVDPYRVVNVDRRWYLMAYDVDRQDWRTFRLDRILSVQRTGHGVRLVDPPDPVSYVSASISTAPYRFQARVVVHAPAEVVARMVPPSVGVIEEIDPGRCRLQFGADDLDYLTVELGTLGHDFEIEAPDELLPHLAAVAARLARAAVSSDRGRAARVAPAPGTTRR